MKYTLFGVFLALALIDGCAPAPTITTVTPSSIPTATLEPTKLSTPTLTSTPEPSKTPTITPTKTVTPRPELLWQRTISITEHLLTQRTTLTDNGVAVDNLNHTDWDGTDAAPISLDSPFVLAVRFEYAGNQGGSLTFSGTPTPNPWWKGLLRLNVNYDRNAVRLEIFDGTSDQRARYFSVPQVKPGDLFYIFFSDPQGKHFSVLDQAGQTVQEVDVTQTNSGTLANGLFPGRIIYPGFNIPPGAKITINEVSLLTPPTSRLAKLREPVNLPSPSLRELASKRGITLGTEVDWSAIANAYDTRYAQVLDTEFAAMITSWGFNWYGTLEPSPSQYNWTLADAVAAYAKSKGLKLCIASLIETTDIAPYTLSVPRWLMDGKYSRDQLLNILAGHVKTVLGRYKGAVSEWQTVNEADFSNQNMLYGRYFTPGNFTGFPNGKFWNDHLEPEVYIEDTFRWAREADPNAVLIYNNDHNETISPWSDFEYNLLARMKQKGVPIDGIGIEMNLFADVFKSDADIQSWKDSVVKNMRRFADLGLGVYITELNVNVGNMEGKSKEEKLAFQAKIYKAAFEACLESGACKTVYLGGFTDAVSWVLTPQFSATYGKGEAPNILDENYNPKPAYFAIRDALLGK